MNFGSREIGAGRREDEDPIPLPCPMAGGKPTLPSARGGLSMSLYE